ncbi:MAG: hypothetical protein ACE5F9_07115 [Phycisphaerae bacterium]
MRFNPRDVLTAIAIISLCAPTVSAQRSGGNSRSRQGRVVRGRGSREHGTVRGKIVRIRLYGKQRPNGGRDSGDSAGSGSKKTGTIAVRTNEGRQYAAVLMRDTAYSVRNATLSPARVRSLLVTGTPVEMNWRTADDLDGRMAGEIRIRTVEIEGVIKSVNRKKIVVMASPKVRAAIPETVTVRGRHPRRPQRGKNPRKRPTRRRLTLSVAGVTTVTLEGEASKLEDLRPTMEFDAVAIDGGPRTVLEIHAREGGQRDPEDRKPREQRERRRS